MMKVTRRNWNLQAGVGLVFVFSAITPITGHGQVFIDEEFLPVHGIRVSEKEFELGSEVQKRKKVSKTSTQASPSTVRIDPSALPNLVPDGNLDALKTASERQLVRCKQLSSKDLWYVDGRILNRKQWCVDTQTLVLDILKRSATWFDFYETAKIELQWYQSVGRNSAREVLYTGYYLPTLRGSRTPDTVYRFPLYRRPSDLVQVDVKGKLTWMRKRPDGTFTPYYTRSEIDQESGGVLANQGLEILYTDSLFDNFILQIQGSGLVDVIEKGGTVRRVSINYSAQNGRPYTAIGSVLRSQGVDPSYISLQGFRRYFAKYPDQLEKILNTNESYVFFSESTTGPYGAAGTIIVPWHSIAVDPGDFPMGAFSLIHAWKPMQVVGDQGQDWQPFIRMTIAQDTGGAIRGPGRVDIFWGSDPYAEIVAGQLAHTGSLYFASVPLK